MYTCHQLSAATVVDIRHKRCRVLQLGNFIGRAAAAAAAVATGSGVSHLIISQVECLFRFLIFFFQLFSFPSPGSCFSFSSLLFRNNSNTTEIGQKFPVAISRTRTRSLHLWNEPKGADAKQPTKMDDCDHFVVLSLAFRFFFPCERY